MSTRTVHRGSHGRWAGSSGGRAERVRVGHRAVAGSRVQQSNHPHLSALGTKANAAAHNRKVQLAVGTAALGGAGYLAYNKVNPGTTLRKSGLAMPGTVTTFGGKSSARPEFTVVKNSTHQFTTTSIGKGMKKTQHTVVEKIGKNGASNPIGYIDSKRTPLGGYRVSHTYLTAPNRGKGLGKQGLAAHAAHRPNRTYRASMNRSNMGQAFAKSVGGAGVRSSKSKTAGSDITKTLDYAWRTGTKADRAGLAKHVKMKTKGMSPNKMRGTGKKLRK